jgi:uncharacterized protein
LSLLNLPELKSLESPRSVIRIPPEIDVPVTPRVMRLIDTQPFRRLAKISQLGLVALVYPGATHTRFEHSLGVYRLALLYMRSLAAQPDFLERVDEEQAKLFLIAALFHDIGHWPYCHPIEDIRLLEIPRHETLARDILCNSEIADCLREDWNVGADQVADVIAPRSSKLPSILASMLSGPIDIDKMDYLDRDSLHAGVPYGRNFDRQRLIGAMCIGPTGNELAITSKGKTAAEMMVFARYVMFSEVYWHHAVRSATAMLQRAVYELRNREDVVGHWPAMVDSQMVDSLSATAAGSPVAGLVEGLVGSKRRLYKRLTQFDSFEHPEIHRGLARRPFHELVNFSQRIADRFSSEIGQKISPCDVLIDAPPAKLEVQFRVSVRNAHGDFCSLEDLSPVVRALATQQFDDVVKKVRIFVAPEIQHKCSQIDITELLHQVIEA